MGTGIVEPAKTAPPGPASGRCNGIELYGVPAICRGPNDKQKLRLNLQT